jgi:hypothetical protein
MRNTERRIRGLVTVLALALLPLAAQAQDSTTTPPNRWRRLAISDGDTTSIDSQSIVREPVLDEVSVWMETRYKTPHTDSLMGKNYTRDLSRFTFNCKARTVWGVASATFTEDGSVAWRDDHPGYPYNAHVAVDPGTEVEIVFEAVCSPSNERLPAGTSTSTEKNHPPSPTELFIPPLPIPDLVRGFHFVADYDIDESGKVVRFSFTPTPDDGYTKRLEDVLKSLKFRPGTSPDGTPVRMKGSVVYDF